MNIRSMQETKKDLTTRTTQNDTNQADEELVPGS